MVSRIDQLHATATQEMIVPDVSSASFARRDHFRGGALTPPAMADFL
jgi:hypothetical protein